MFVQEVGRHTCLLSVYDEYFNGRTLLMTLESGDFPVLYLFVFLFGLDLSCRELFNHFTVWNTSQLMITDQVSFYKNHSRRS